MLGRQLKELKSLMNGIGVGVRLEMGGGPKWLCLKLKLIDGVGDDVFIRRVWKIQVKSN